MADRKITVLNPAGYQELLQSGDSLLVDGDINLQTNRITGLPSPTLSVDAAPKSYVDSGDNTNATSDYKVSTAGLRMLKAILLILKPILLPYPLATHRSPSLVQMVLL